MPNDAHDFPVALPLYAHAILDAARTAPSRTLLGVDADDGRVEHARVLKPGWRDHFFASLVHVPIFGKRSTTVRTALDVTRRYERAVLAAGRVREAVREVLAEEGGQTLRATERTPLLRRRLARATPAGPMTMTEAAGVIRQAQTHLTARNETLMFSALYPRRSDAGGALDTQIPQDVWPMWRQEPRAVKQFFEAHALKEAQTQGDSPQSYDSLKRLLTPEAIRGFCARSAALYAALRAAYPDLPLEQVMNQIEVRGENPAEQREHLLEDVGVCWERHVAHQQATHQQAPLPAAARRLKEQDLAAAGDTGTPAAPAWDPATPAREDWSTRFAVRLQGAQALTPQMREWVASQATQVVLHPDQLPALLALHDAVDDDFIDLRDAVSARQPLPAALRARLVAAADAATTAMRAVATTHGAPFDAAAMRQWAVRTAVGAALLQSTGLSVKDTGFGRWLADVMHALDMTETPTT